MAASKIVIYKPDGLDYYIAQSPFKPATTAKILRELLERMEKSLDVRRN